MSMVETNESGPIEIASKHSSVSSLREKAAIEREAEKKVPTRIQVDLSHLEESFQDIAEGQRDLIGSLEAQRISLDSFLSLSQKQSGELVESFKRAPQREERERWVDAEYAQDFFTRFTPNLEPNFYTQLSRKEREKFNVRWQLARAAFYKQAINGTPDKYRDSEDLNNMGKEKMEILYNIKGVREMLQGYTQAIIDGTPYDYETVKDENGKENQEPKTFWDIKDADEFHNFRRKIREQSLANVSFDEELKVLPDKLQEELEDGEGKKAWIDLFKKEADAIAWNWLWVSNVVEAANSRYADSAAGYSRNLPGVLAAGEFQHVLHPQERFEGKCGSGHFWKAFGKWGVSHYRKLKEREGVRKEDEIWFVPAKAGEYWDIDRLPGATPRDTKNKEKGGKVYQMNVPECYPVTTTKSFLEMTECTEDKKNLLEVFRVGEDVDWSEVLEDAWPAYLWGKFHKGYKLLEYWDNIESGKEGKPLERRKPFSVKAWADPLLELFVRLNPGKIIKDINTTEDGEERKPKRTHQTLNNIKVWAVIASTGGVGNIESRNPTFTFSLKDRGTLSLSLRNRQTRFLENKEKLAIT